MHETGIWLHGIPDEILEFPNGDICIVDHKTAKPKAGGDPFMPQYEMQVIGYSRIAEELGLGKVAKAGLLYWGVDHETVKAKPEEFYIEGQIMVPFVPSVHEVELDYALIDPLLKEYKKIHCEERPRKGRDGCQDCKRLTALLDLDHDLLHKDHLLLASFGNIKVCRDDVQRRMYERNLTRLGSMDSADLYMEDGGMWSNWQFDGDVCSP